MTFLQRLRMLVWDMVHPYPDDPFSSPGGDPGIPTPGEVDEFVHAVRAREAAREAYAERIGIVPFIDGHMIYDGDRLVCVYLDEGEARAALKPGQELRPTKLADLRTTR